MNITMNNNHEINEQELQSINAGAPVFISEPIDPEPGSFLDRLRKWFNELVTN